MFLFKKSEKEKEVKETNFINRNDLIVYLQNMEKDLEKIDKENKVKILNELGKGYFSINEIDKAINFYEISILECKEFGKAYTDLIKLYNIKRKEAIEQKNDEKLKFYMDKINILMQMSKDTIRGKF